MKLRQAKFKLPGFDHLYVVCSPDLADHAVVAGNAMGRMRFVDVGLSVSRWQTLTDDAKHDELVDVAIHAAEHFSRDPPLCIVAAELKALRSEVEIASRASNYFAL